MEAWHARRKDNVTPAAPEDPAAAVFGGGEAP
jgi:hypothetical protein